MSFYEDRIFPIVLDLATRPVRADRIRLVAAARGRVLEIGAGGGANLPYYGPEAREVVGLEPAQTLLDDARRVAAGLPGSERFSFVAAGAEALPFADASFDTVVACLVFCTIPDTASAAREMHRVLRPGGDLLFFEHVVHPRAGVRRWQERLDPLWTKLACGCHLTRDTTQVFRDAGFRFRELDAFEHPKIPALVNAMIRGSATRD